MTRDVTLETRRDGEADMAPATSAPSLARAQGPSGSIAQPEKPMGVPPTGKRRKTAGEITFDVSTYGGLSLIGNELASTVIVKQAKQGFLTPVYEPFVEFFKNLKPLNKFNYIGEGRLPYILTACVGGMLLVLPVKWMEDRKGSIVRKLDNVFHKNQETPELKQAHEEMDNAPKQSWKSLGEGRLITVGAAIVVDALVGWQKSVVTKLFEGTKTLKNFSSFDRTATTLARHTMLKFGLGTPEQRAAVTDTMDTIRHGNKELGEHFVINAKTEGKMVDVLATGGSLLTLSAALTVLFYATSKMFAHGQEKKKILATDPARAKQLGYRDGVAEERSETLPDAGQARETTTSAPTSDTPGTRIAQVENLSRVNDATALQAGV